MERELSPENTEKLVQFQVRIVLPFLRINCFTDIKNSLSFHNRSCLESTTWKDV